MIKIAPHTYTIEETDPFPLPIPTDAECSVTINHQLVLPNKQYTPTATYIQVPPNSTLYFYTPQQGQTGEPYNPIPEQSLNQNALHSQKHTIHELSQRQQNDDQNTTLAQRASTAWKTHVFANSPSINLLPAKNISRATIQSHAITKNTPKALQMYIAAPTKQMLYQKSKINLIWDEDNKYNANNINATYNKDAKEFNVIWRFNESELEQMKKWEERYGVLVYYVGYGSIVGKRGEIEVTRWSEGIRFGINKVPGRVLVLSMGV